MLFSENVFLFAFLPAVLAVYYLCPRVLRNPVLLIFSLVFYGWGEPVYLILMVAAIALNYLFGLLIHGCQRRGSKGTWALVTGVAVNLLLLGYFKYAGFVLAQLQLLIPALGSVSLPQIQLPIGISFYIFQSMSYIIDVYRNDTQVQKNPLDFGTYVALFPQLIAGPIVRYTDVAERLNILKGRITMDRIDDGITLFIFGLAKKVLIANSVGALWTEINGMGLDTVSTPLAWLGILAFTFQIYFDFSGYSLMAIGLGKMLGFDFPDNFNHPYISKSITEFWRRWHMTLGSWFREYVYIPLGGNRKGKGRQILNMAVVWFLTGFWHGADWNFILWGLFYLVLLMIEKLWLLKKLDKVPVLAHIYTMLFVVIGWAIFEITDLSMLGGFLVKLFDFSGGVSAVYYLRNYAVIFILAAVFSTPLPIRIYDTFKQKTWARWLCLTVLLALVIAYLSNASYNPFLYFRF